MFISPSCKLHSARMLCLIFLLVFPSIAGAHSIFIQSGRYQVSKGKGTPLFFCFGHHFPVDDALRRKKLSYVKVIDPGGETTEVVLRNEKSLHSYVVDYEKPGTYSLVAETNPGYFAMYIDKKGRKRHSLKPLSSFIENADSILSSMRSSQWAKTYVTCENPSTEFPTEIGLPLELLPANDLSTLKVGDNLTFTVHFDGKPYTGEGVWDATYSGFSTVAEDMYFQQTKITGGEFTMPVEHSGRWFVRFFTKTDAPEGKKSEYLTEKRTATLTFEISNERKRPKIDSY